MEAGEFFIDVLRRSQSLYIPERVADMHDICQRLLEEIYGAEFQPAAVKLKTPIALACSRGSGKVDTIMPRISADAAAPPTP